MQNLTVEQLKFKMEQGESFQLLDVREPSEHKEFNIGGVLLPLGQIQIMHIDAIEDWKNKEVICYCRSGNRSAQACMYLQSFGFTNTKNLTGGMIAWKQKYGSLEMK